MEISEKELTQARDTVESLLEQLGLSAYLFEVEPRADHWEVRVECAPDSGWQSSVLVIDENWMQACRIDAGARAQLLSEWRKRLQA
jgi:hypothetical protein